MSMTLIPHDTILSILLTRSFIHLYLSFGLLSISAPYPNYFIEHYAWLPGRIQRILSILSISNGAGDIIFRVSVIIAFRKDFSFLELTSARAGRGAPRPDPRDTAGPAMESSFVSGLRQRSPSQLGSARPGRTLSNVCTLMGSSSYAQLYTWHILWHHACEL
ncbi:hypothetical protein F5887DRAFT_93292 [Amanita rubescens]|nr:hypothetical protein F5887DRAFT_93292 [Amanita rubescens]